MATQKDLTEQQKVFLDALMGEAAGNVRAAMDVAGYSRNTKTIDTVRRLKDEILETTQTYLASNGPRAALAMTGVLEDPTALGNRDRINASREILDRVGVIKTEKVAVQAESGGLFILPAKKKQEEDD